MTVQHNPDSGGTARPGIRRIAGRSVGYSRVSDVFARDRDLTPRASRVGLYALSHREGWVMAQRSIAEALAMSETTVRGALDDLAAAGYLRSWTVRDDRGHVKGTAYVVHDEPLDDDQWQIEIEAVGGPAALAAESTTSTRPADMHESLTTDSVGRDSVGRDSDVHKGDQFHKGDQEPKGTPYPSPLRGEDDEAADGALPGMPTPAPVETAPTDEYEAEPGFVEFWTTYPSSKGKRAALLAYRRARKRGATAETILAGAQRYAAERAGAEARFTAHAATWLNGARYDDVPDTSNPSPARASAVREPEPATATFEAITPADDPEYAPFDPDAMPEHIARRMQIHADATGWSLAEIVRNELDYRAARRDERDADADALLSDRTAARAAHTPRGRAHR